MDYNFGHLTKYTLIVCIHHLCHVYLSFLSVYAVAVHVCFSGGSYPVWPIAVIPGFWRGCGGLAEDGAGETKTDASAEVRRQMTV